MTPTAIPQAAQALSAYYKARVLCFLAEPHGVSRRPCQRHCDEAERQLAERAK